MTDLEQIERTIAFVKETLQGAEGGHDWFHIQRVFNNALLIAKDEKKADIQVVGLAALLHDIADAKFHDGDESLGPQLAREFLLSLEADASIIDHVIMIIENISFKSGLKSSGKGKAEERLGSLELQVVQDADRLDAIGAIGIARAFNYG